MTLKVCSNRLVWFLVTATLYDSCGGEGGQFNQQPSEYRMTVHLFGVTSSPGCTNYALKMTAETFEAVHGQPASEFIKKDFYVDDGLKSVESLEVAIQLIKSSQDLCKSGGFNLYKYICNNKSVVEQMPPDIRAKDVQNFDITHDILPVGRTLGVEWCIESDSFQFTVTLKDKPPTRRGILLTICSIYDPLGLVAPFLLTDKRILQQLCRDNKGWDDPIPDDIYTEWSSWRSELVNLAKKPRTLEKSRALNCVIFPMPVWKAMDSAVM